MAWEYNPFHNYQTDVDIYEKDGFLIPFGQAVNKKNGELLNKRYDSQNATIWVDKRDSVINSNDVITWDDKRCSLYAKAGSLLDLDTDKLKFDLNHPVDIQIQPSYDGSVNLIINDDKNIPRLINSRFSTREKNTYEIVDRIGENDTNIYNSRSFDKDTALYFQYESNPIIDYRGFVKGVLPVGQYCFYITYCDADENESDYTAESGLIPVFIGTDGVPQSIDGGIKNQLSDKGVRLKISNLDSSYNYFKVYYVRYFADYQQNRVFECKKIYRKYPINSSTVYLQITGNENAEDMDANILNITRFNPKSVLTSAQCKNMLFFGNIVKNMDDYRELSDLALRIVPSLDEEQLSNVDNTYDTNKGTGYYSSDTIYNKTGYFDQEYYRFGVVFIYQNGTLSNVYNTLGATLKKYDGTTKLEYITNTIYSDHTTEDNKLYALTRKYIAVDDFGWIKNESEFYNSGENLNAKGVCKIDFNSTDINTILGIKFNVPNEVQKYLKEKLGIRGLFFVRQKCIPNILAQCYLMPMDEVLEAPVIQSGDNYYSECFMTQDSTRKNVKLSKEKGRDIYYDGRYIRNSYNNRLYKFKNSNDSNASSISKHAYAAICPDFLLNQPYYNQIFNGANFRIQKISNKESSDLIKDGRFYYIDNDPEKFKLLDNRNASTSKVRICTVTEAVPTVAIEDKIYRTEIGKAEEGFRFRYVEVDNGTYDAGQRVKNQYEKGNSADEAVYEATNLVRGIYSPYLAIYSENKLDTNCLYNIYSNIVPSVNQEFQIRMDSSEPFYAISNRYNFDQLNNNSLTCWRGDCYVNTFTYRLNRNFNDPSLPNNDVIIDPNTWIDNYTKDQTKWKDISLSDINAVQMGSWITFKVRSAMNYALRSEDHSYVSEEALMGAPRSFYPRSYLMYHGENKLPDSYLYNDAYRASLGFKCYFTLQDINYLKNVFSNRIQYSAISIQDSYKNNYRYSLSTYFRDYSSEYGSITKIIGLDLGLFVVFEHGIGFIKVDETVLQSNEGSPIFINTDNVLPQQLSAIISDTIGSQWTESIIKSDSGFIYGVDTVAKKIWRSNGQNLEILSDFKVNKFLVDNITLTERELQPFVGLKNVKTHYNNNKKDVMFTFYDDVYQDEEKVWNLCFNELLYSGNENSGFSTFYSWVPSYSENIDTLYFSFDRTVSKLFALLSKCNYSILENSGVLVDNPVMSYVISDNKRYSQAKLHYRDPIFGDIKDEAVTFRLEKDHWKNNEKFEIIEGNILRIETTKFDFQEQKGVPILYITPIVNKEELTKEYKENLKTTEFSTESIAVTIPKVIYGEEPIKDSYRLTSDFYIHGRSGIIDIKENIYPCYWYGEQHPFEFEFVVNDKLNYQKIFSNLVMIANKATPESFHFEIEGDNYDWSEDKRNMYFRQEATKELYQNLGSDVLFNREYTDVATIKYNFNPIKDYHNLKGEWIENYGYDGYDGLVQNPKSTIFPLYYNRIDTYNDIYHQYQLINKKNMDYENLSGSEIVWNRDLNQFNIVTHIKNSPINIVGRVKGNSHYKEGMWDIQIPSIVYMQKNENKWNTNNWTTPDDGSDSTRYDIPPLVLNWTPDDIQNPYITTDILPKLYNDLGQISLDNWTNRKETRIRDKWIKIRVRYSGKELAIIHSLITLYNLSYA